MLEEKEQSSSDAVPAPCAEAPYFRSDRFPVNSQQVCCVRVLSFATLHVHAEYHVVGIRSQDVTVKVAQSLKDAKHSILRLCNSVELHR